ncbi:hypothetical protein BCR37DRAFT_379185 [Protomyces lactucae-debilis]|uniref:Metallo-dependent phosphatase-like protein n=1 Tax=Protomyces lactucae-debilis TaxID=2754530 RepID=A0A1Y2FGY1_PROLT|nr:uncharacterized protein BCR37DRAFT_379185 [Protomyces lactucae-debilis]ORY83189.1 hypothetical protein BCR37DRAFT_379185 [Protomyces lactucae-debilis]
MRQYAINLREQRRLQARWRSDEARLAGIIMLQNESIEVVVRGRRLNVYGSPLSPFYCDWAFSYAPDEDPWRIREDVDIVITHSPPKGTMDLVPGLVHDGHVGCPHLRDRISQVKPMLHVFGHIRECLLLLLREKKLTCTDEGAEQGLQRTSLDDGGEILSVNAALLNERYEVAYDATVVDL